MRTFITRIPIGQWLIILAVAMVPLLLNLNAMWEEYGPNIFGPNLVVLGFSVNAFGFLFRDWLVLAAILLPLT